MTSALNENKEITQQTETKDQIVDLQERSKISGSSSAEFTNKLHRQVALTCENMMNATANLDAHEVNQTTEEILKGISPRDEIEGMLAAQMIAVHNASMRSFLHVNASSTTTHNSFRESVVNQGVKLSRTYATLMQTLHLYRSNANENKVNVNRVHIHEGGQAIVGNVSQEKK